MPMRQGLYLREELLPPASVMNRAAVLSTTQICDIRFPRCDAVHAWPVSLTSHFSYGAPWNPALVLHSSLQRQNDIDGRAAILSFVRCVFVSSKFQKELENLLFQWLPIIMASARAAIVSLVVFWAASSHGNIACASTSYHVARTENCPVPDTTLPVNSRTWA
jgi:hypothetical protein